MARAKPSAKLTLTPGPVALGGKKKMQIEFVVQLYSKPNIQKYDEITSSFFRGKC